MKSSALIALTVVGALGAACTREPEQPPPQPYYPQQQPPPQAYPPPQAAPAPTPAATPAPAPTPTTTTPAPAASGGTPTSIPGVMKYPDGTCSVTLPGNPQPMKGPCPPGV